MYLARCNLNVKTEIDNQGCPVPTAITLESGRQLPIKGVMERGAVSTAAGITTYRYEVWMDERSYVIYLDNTIPLRWYVDVVLPFKAEREEHWFMPQKVLAEAAD